MLAFFAMGPAQRAVDIGLFYHPSKATSKQPSIAVSSNGSKEWVKLNAASYACRQRQVYQKTPCECALNIAVH